MLLKSSSNPALNSWFQQHNLKGSSSPDVDLINRNLKSIKSPTVSLYSPKKITRASSESDLISLSIPKCRNSINSLNCLISNASVVEDVEAEEMESRGLLFSSSGLDVNGGCGVRYLTDGTGGGGGSGKICGGAGAGGGDNGDGGNRSDGTDAYYQNMIQANPGNSLILGNYAKYLKEVRGDVVKAEEYCSRAILSNPSDGNALSMYADLIWETQKDASRAQNYFDQAVKASPDDCYVMASYARFLWDADEDDEEEVSNMNMQTPSFLHETSQQFPIAAV